jgi:DUF1365 family protein
VSAPGPGLYVGRLRHARHAPRTHVFTYPVFQAFLDIDRIPEAMAVSRFTSYNRWNWASFLERDHFGDPARPLRERVAAEAASAGVHLPEGPIYLLTNLRYLGYCFNPVSFFYCYDGAGRLETVLAEVNNTFGETCNYWLTDRQAVASAGGRGQVGGPRGARRYRTPKVFHVSPFMSLTQEYEWLLTPPGARLVMHIGVVESGVRMLDATLDLRHHPWSAPVIRRTLARYPWTTAKVIAAIHYEALRLHLKGIRYRPHPGTPPSAGRPRARPAGSAA